MEKRACIGWIENIFHDCVCNFQDEISFGFGMTSLIFWAVAEIPQIISNFNDKSAMGVSLAFISTWIVGDVFNLLGCLLEPGTLPTQLYTAVLYTTVTILLAFQCIYYNHFSKLLCRDTNIVKDEREPLVTTLEDGKKTTKNVPVGVPRDSGKFYFMSARSLAGSNTPPFHSSSYIKARSGPPALENDLSSDEEDDQQSYIPTHPLSIPTRSVVGYATFVAASTNLPHLSKALRLMPHSRDKSGMMILQEQEIPKINAVGQWLGWLMAAIYMGGRIPQIWLNIKRGSVEGLNPLMFVFALLANATYVGSILLRTSEWRMIKANLPWLLDAAVCVALDLFIILQYIFYKYIKAKKIKHFDHGNVCKLVS